MEIFHRDMEIYLETWRIELRHENFKIKIFVRDIRDMNKYYLFYSKVYKIVEKHFLKLYDLE